MRYEPAPLMVPPVPTPWMKTSTEPLVCAHTSGPVVWTCASGLASFQNWFVPKYVDGSDATSAS